MSDERESEEEDHEQSPRAVLQAEPVRARPRHSLPGRLARAARAALQSHFPALPSMKATASSRIPLAPERATLLFRSGALETHISRALGNTVGLNSAASKELSNVFSTVKSFPGAARAAWSKDASFRQLQLSGKHSVGASTVLETTIQGTQVSLLELQLRMVHKLISPQQVEQAQPKPAGHIALTTGTNLQSRHRLTLESTFGCEEDKHTLSTVFSSDFHSGLSWGLSSFTNLSQKLAIFSRYNNDAHAGQRVIWQLVTAILHKGDGHKAVQKLDDRNTISPICAATVGRQIQGGISWTHALSQFGAGEDSLQVKLLFSSNGAFMISLKAQYGAVDVD